MVITCTQISSVIILQILDMQVATYSVYFCPKVQLMVIQVTCGHRQQGNPRRSLYKLTIHTHTPKYHCKRDLVPPDTYTVDYIVSDCII
jgi:hypothetical protein